MRRAVLLALALALAAGVAEARTWWVKKDGSGDYTVIQAAVDAAASGDTIRIGPGVFEEENIWVAPNGAVIQARVLVRLGELTFIGSGIDQTVIGQSEPWEVPQGDHKGFFAHSHMGSARVVVEDLTIQNARGGVYGWETEVVINRCRFIGCHLGISLLNHQTSGLYVKDSIFDDLARNGASIHTHWLAVAEIRDSKFAHGPSHWPRWHIAMNSTDSAVIENCEFIGSSKGIQLDQRTTARITRCTFDGQSPFGISTGVWEVRATVEDCVFRNQRRAVFLYEGTQAFTMTHCVFENVSEASVYIHKARGIQINDCDLAQGEQYAVKAVLFDWDPGVHELDFTNNYWGTDDAGEIAAMIHDANAHDGTNYVVVFKPFRTESVPVVPVSLSDIKRMFR
jgi:hypothetical protein